MKFEGGHDEVGVGGASVRKSPLICSFSLSLLFEFGSEMGVEEEGTSL